MVAFTILRQATRATAGPARLVAGMRVSLVSSASSCSARPIVSKLSSNAVRGVGVRAFSGSARRFGSGTSEWFPVPTHILSNSFICVADVSLSQRLQEELNYEQDAIAQTGDSTAEFLKTFLEQGIWSVSYPFFFCCVFYNDGLLILIKVDDARGNAEMTISRKFGDEKCVGLPFLLSPFVELFWPFFCFLASVSYLLLQIFRPKRTLMRRKPRLSQTLKT